MKTKVLSKIIAVLAFSSITTISVYASENKDDFNEYAAIEIESNYIGFEQYNTKCL